MKDKEFKNLDEAMMKSMASLREQKVSEGMLKGFSASVERKIQPDSTPVVQHARRWAPVWVPTLAVMVLASVAVLRAPVELAQMVSSDEIQNEVAILKELGALTDEEEATVLGDELELYEDLESELSQYLRQSTIA